MFYGNFWNSGSCTCAAGVVTGGGTCADDIEPVDECENLMSLVCKSNGVAEGSRVTKANGCDRCKTLRKICATTKQNQTKLQKHSQLHNSKSKTMQNNTKTT